MNTYTIKNILNHVRITIEENSRITHEYDVCPQDVWMHEVMLEDAGYVNINNVDIYCDHNDDSWLVYDYTC